MFTATRAVAAATYCKPLFRIGRDRGVRNPLYAAEIAGIGSSPSWMSTLAGKKANVRKLLPPELSRNVVMLKYGKTDVYVIGTAHRFKESHQQVEAVIKLLEKHLIRKIDIHNWKNDSSVNYIIELPRKSDSIRPNKHGRRLASPYASRALSEALSSGDPLRSGLFGGRKKTGITVLDRWWWWLAAARVAVMIWLNPAIFI